MINLEPLITRNLQVADFMKSIAKTTTDEIYPTLTVSRDSGSGGGKVAKEVAKALRIKFFDDELIDMVAKEAKTKKKLVAALDERSQSAIDSIVNSFLGFESLPENTFIKSLATVALSISSAQPAVILGRGMNFILPPASNFRVRVTAPRRKLINYAMKYEGHSKEKARRIIDKYNGSRREFVYKYFSKDLTKAHYYDVVVSTEYFSIEDAVQVIIAGFREKFGL